MDPLSLKSLVFLLPVLGCCAAQGILPPGMLEVVLGRNVTFPTLLTNPDYAFIIWNFNDGEDQIHVATVSSTGVKVNAPYAGRVELNQTNGFLRLSSVRLEDKGDYGINVVSKDGDTKTDDVHLRVLEPVSDVVITPNMADAIENNSTVVLNCSAKGSFLTFTWTNGSSPVAADGKHVTLKTDGASSTLTVTSVYRSDLVGPIVCTASNNLETHSSNPFNLTVYYGPDLVSISPPPSLPLFLSSDANFSLSCSAASCSPPPIYKWYHSQQLMDVTGPVLTLQAIMERGLGKQMESYTCTATNQKSLVAVPSPSVSLTVMDPISGATITGPTFPLIAGNSSANLSCQAASGTATTVVWRRNDKLLTPSTRLVFSDNMSSLAISPVQREDQGEYSCGLENPVSNAKAVYRMLVNFGPDDAKVTGKSKVEVNQAVTLTCSAESVPPANFTWKFNGTVTDVRTREYVIAAASAAANGGIYTCEAYNGVTGKTTAGTFTLSVYEKGSIPPEGLSDGAIAGIVIAILVAVGVALALTLYCRQKVPIESPY